MSDSLPTHDPWQATPGSCVHGILQARILEWVAIPSRDLPNPGLQPGSPALQMNSLSSQPPGKPYTSLKTHSLRFALAPVHRGWDFGINVIGRKMREESPLGWVIMNEFYDIWVIQRDSKFTRFHRDNSFLVQRDAGKSTVFTKRNFRGFISGIKTKELSLAEVREKAPKLSTDFDGYMWVIWCIR